MYTDIQLITPLFITKPKYTDPCIDQSSMKTIIGIILIYFIQFNHAQTLLPANSWYTWATTNGGSSFSYTGGSVSATYSMNPAATQIQFTNDCSGITSCDRSYTLPNTHGCFPDPSSFNIDTVLQCIGEINSCCSTGNDRWGWAGIWYKT